MVSMYNYAQGMHNVKSCCVAGTMLSRLYQLQTENQQMQERITNLAAQREFLLATNSQLGSIISESQQHQQHTSNGLSEPTYNMSVETADIVTSSCLPTPPSSSNTPSTTTSTTSNASLTTVSSDTRTNSNISVLVQASNYPYIDSPNMFTLPTTSATTTIAASTSNEIIKPGSVRSKELKKQRNIKHSKQSTKSQQQQHVKANPAAMPGSVSVLGPPLFATIKASEVLPTSSSVLIGSLVPLEPTTAVTSELTINPQVTIPLSHAAQTLPPFREIAMELNGKTVTLPRDITAVTSAIGGPIPAMSPVASGHNVVR